MTNKQFAAWAGRHFRSNMACADALQLDRDAIRALATGKTRKGNDAPIPAYVALACAAWTIGVDPATYDGKAVQIGG
jgi:hypothetical protein